MTIRIAEFYSGIGGMHYAALMAGIDTKVVRAFDLDDIANATYAHNFGKGIATKKDIGQLHPKELESLDAQMWLMSPSCQPYTVIGKQKGIEDPRALSFIHVIGRGGLGGMHESKRPNWILIENVAGFEASTARMHLRQTISDLGYQICEFLLNPLQFGIPNSRLRYYFLAVKLPICQGFPSGNKVLHKVPHLSNGDQTGMTTDDTMPAISHFLDLFVDHDKYSIPDKVLQKWGRLFDIVKPSAYGSCCFTRGYSRMVEGGGSILQEAEDVDTTDTFLRYAASVQKDAPESDSLDILRPLRLRYFTPMEISRLMGFNKPGEADIFSFPPTISLKSQYKLLGNSINCYVVAKLIRFLINS